MNRGKPPNPVAKARGFWGIYCAIEQTSAHTIGALKIIDDGDNPQEVPKMKSEMEIISPRTFRPCGAFGVGGYDMFRESKITINGKELSGAESMAIRVAVTSFWTDLSNGGLGDDSTGKAICAGYIAACKTISEKMGLK